MRKKIKEDIKSAVLRMHLEGNTRDAIALECGIASGTVSKIVSEWKSNIGHYLVEDLRELGINLKKFKIHPGECANGLRILNILQRMGVRDEDKIEALLLSIITSCEDHGISAENIAKYLRDLTDFSSNNNDNITFSTIPQYLDQMKNKNAKLQCENLELNSKKEKLIAEISMLTESRDQVLKEKKMTDAQLERYKNLECGLADQGFLSIDNDEPDVVNNNVDEFLRLVSTLRELSFDPAKVLSAYQDTVIWKAKQKIICNDINTKASQVIQLTNYKQILEKHCDYLNSVVEWHIQRLTVFEQLEEMGFTMYDLRLIYNTLREIAFENSTSYDQARREFFKKIEMIYKVSLNNNNSPNPSKAVNIAMFITKDPNNKGEPKS